MESKEMRMKLMVGTLTKETRTFVVIGIAKKGSTWMKISQQEIIMVTRMMKSLGKSTVR
jgi:hypothetical protein